MGTERIVPWVQDLPSAQAAAERLTDFSFEKSPRTSESNSKKKESPSSASSTSKSYSSGSKPKKSGGGNTKKGSAAPVPQGNKHSSGASTSKKPLGCFLCNGRGGRVSAQGGAQCSSTSTSQPGSGI